MSINRQSSKSFHMPKSRGPVLIWFRLGQVELTELTVNENRATDIEESWKIKTLPLPPISFLYSEMLAQTA